MGVDGTARARYGPELCRCLDGLAKHVATTQNLFAYLLKIRRAGLQLLFAAVHGDGNIFVPAKLVLANATVLDYDLCFFDVCGKPAQRFLQHILAGGEH